MATTLVYGDGSRQALPGRVALTRQDNDITKPDTVQAAFSTQLLLPDDVATHKRLGLPQIGTSLSTVPYQGVPCVLEAGGVEVLPGARFALDDYTPRTGYAGRLLGGNKAFYDLLVKADGSDLNLRDLDLSAFDHDWTLGAVAAGAGRTRWQQGYCYDLYDRGLGAPPVVTASSSRLYEAGYWPTAYARAVWEAVFQAVSVQCTAELPAVFDQALLPATYAFGYSDLTRAAHQVVAGYPGAAQDRYFEDEQDTWLPFTQTVPTKRDPSLALGTEAQFDVASSSATITVAGYYDLKAEQDVHLFCNSVFDGEVSATVQLFLNGQPVGMDDSIRGKGQLDAVLTALAERQLLQVGDVVVARYKLDKWKNPLTGIGPFDYGWSLRPNGQLRVELLADFPPRGRVKLADWLPDLACKDYVKGIIQLYGLTQTTDPYTGAVTFRRTGAHVLAGVLPGGSGQDWSARRDGSTPAKRSWQLGDLARRNWFRWKDDDTNPAYQQAVFELTHSGLGWDADAAKAKAKAFAAGYLDNGTGDVNLDASKDVLTLPFAASPLGAEGLLLVPRWKPKAGSDYLADLQTIADALADGTYSKVEADAARVKALGDDYDTQEPQPRLCYRRPFAERAVLLEDDQGTQQQVLLPTSYFVDAGQAEDFDFTRSLLPAYYPHLAAALVRPLVLRPDVRLSAAEVVGFDQLVPVWLDDEAAWFYVNKVDGWEDGQPSTAVELVRLL